MREIFCNTYIFDKAQEFLQINKDTQPSRKKRQKIRTISHKRKYSNGHQSYERIFTFTSYQ